MLKTLKLRKNYESWFGATPARMYADRRLTPRDRDVYGVISMCLLGKPGEIEITEEEIAEFLGISARGVRRSIHSLVYAKELDVRRVMFGGNAYRLTTPPFVAKAPQAPVAAPMPKRELIACPTCRKRVRGLLKTGWCRSCGWEKKTRKVVQDELERQKTA